MFITVTTCRKFVSRWQFSGERISIPYNKYCGWLIEFWERSYGGIALARNTQEKILHRPWVESKEMLQSLNDEIHFSHRIWGPPSLLSTGYGDSYPVG